MTTTLGRAPHAFDAERLPLATTLDAVLEGTMSARELAEIDPDRCAEHDALLALLGIHDLWLAPLESTRGRAYFQHHPAVVCLKWSLEQRFIDRVEQRSRAAAIRPGDTVGQLRRIAARGLVPAVYDWLATSSNWSEFVEFVTLEGGPDADFDDLVALAQVGLCGDPKVALAANYWDEMGRGQLARVHTVLHDELVEAIDMPSIPRSALPTSALARKALGGVVATNRRLQPEALGALGLIEMQAGPRCRAVVRALDRLDAPAGAYPFYEEHAEADPLHGKEWLDRVVAPLANDPLWDGGIVRGALWRDAVNQRFFTDVLHRFRSPLRRARPLPGTTGSHPDQRRGP